MYLFVQIKRPFYMNSYNISQEYKRCMVSTICMCYVNLHEGVYTVDQSTTFNNGKRSKSSRECFHSVNGLYCQREPII